ncbi:hypothetical protein NJB1728e24_01540, partial [Mycobacterium marinum]
LMGRLRRVDRRVIREGGDGSKTIDPPVAEPRMGRDR